METEELIEYSGRIITLLVLIIVLLSFVIITWAVFYSRRVKSIQKYKAVLRREKYKDMFFSAVTWKMRKAVNVLLQYMQLVGMDVDKEDKKSVEQVFVSNIKQVKIILNNIIMISGMGKNDNGNILKRKMNVDNICCHEVEKYSEYYIHNKKLKLQATERIGPFTINGDGKYLRCILDNLLDNAGKFAPSGTVRVNYGRQEGYMVVSVSDEGCGISTDLYNSIFRTVTSRKNDDNTVKYCTGLFTSWTIANYMGWNLFLDKDYHNGCRMELDIPLEEE